MPLLLMVQDKTPKRGCRWPVLDNPHRSRLTRRPSHNWSSTVRAAHQGRRSWWGGSDPWKYVGRVRVCFDPLKMSHSFIQNCCCITASFTASRMNSWTLSLHLHWSCLCWRCYHPYIWSAPSRQCPRKWHFLERKPKIKQKWKFIFGRKQKKPKMTK